MNQSNNGYGIRPDARPTFDTRFNIGPHGTTGKWSATVGGEGGGAIIAIDEDRGSLLERCKASVGLLQQEGGSAQIHVFDQENRFEATLQFYPAPPQEDE